VDIAAVLDADRSDARIRSGGNADRISGGVTGISGGGRDGNVAAVRHTDWAATNGEHTAGSTHRRGARNIPAVLDADGAVDSCGGEDAEVVAAPACCNVAAIDDTDGAVAEPGLYTKMPLTISSLPMAVISPVLSTRSGRWRKRRSHTPGRRRDSWPLREYRRGSRW
jgi:hypothetical protein